ncbi:MAG: regulatory protein RecX [Anaerococcus sp.]|nr:regulatory protein RecX [Anaerococcus sp.]
MIVEEIGYSDKYNLVRLKISGDLLYISYDLFNNYDLHKGSSLDFKTYKEILAEDSYNKAKNYILNRISYANKTSFEIRKILKDKGYNDDIILRLIDYLNSYRLIDDETFVKSFIIDKSRINSWPKNKIRYKLKAKGISDSLIDRYIDDLIDEDDEYNKALNFAQKKARGDYSISSKNKVYRHLASKGFSFDIISRAIEEVFS